MFRLSTTASANSSGVSGPSAGGAPSAAMSSSIRSASLRGQVQPASSALSMKSRYSSKHVLSVAIVHPVGCNSHRISSTDSSRGTCPKS